MRYLFILLALLNGKYLTAQDHKCDSIAWTSNRKLSWNDFKASPDTSTKDIALSYTRFQYKWKLSGDTLKVLVLNYFRPCMAWSKSKNGDTLLMHEQGHFDISEYFKRSFAKRITGQHFKRQTARSDIITIYNDINAQQQQLVELYESKTDFGRIREAQLQWNTKIMSMVNSLQEFSSDKFSKLLND